MSTSVPRSFILTTAAVVGLLPFAADMYLSSLPAIGAEFDAPVWVTQLTLTGFLLVLGLGQLVTGPITDALGRRRPLLFGLGLFTLGSLLAALAPSMAVLVAGRLLQGVAGALAVVIANSSVRDSAAGTAATRLYAVLMTVAGLAPVIAPTAGGLLEQVVGWRSVFIALTVLGALVMASAATFLPESLPQARRTPFAPRGLASLYGGLLRTRAFAVPLAALSALFMMLFAYIGGASYVYQDHYGLDPAAFGLLFGATGLAFLLGAVIAHRLAGSLPAVRQALVGSLVALGGGAAAVLATAAGAPMLFVVLGMAVGLLGLGIAEPPLMSRCMSAVESSTGAAAALIGASQYALGAAATVVAGVLAARSPVLWAGLIALFALAGVLLVRLVPTATATGSPVPLPAMSGAGQVR